MEKLKNFFSNLFRRKNKIVIYTAIFGNYDDLKIYEKKYKKYDFYCFTDNKNLKSELFKIVLTKKRFDDNTRDAKYYKMFPHLLFPNYEYSIWIDGSVLIKKFNFKKIINKFLKKDNIAFFKHPDRDCIYEEMEACLGAEKDNTEKIINQINKYRLDNYPAHNGLIAGGIIIRRHNNPEIIKLDENWWSEIENNSKRDQLSFNYVAWKNKINYSIIPGCLWNNKYFKVLEHLDINKNELELF